MIPADKPRRKNPTPPLLSDRPVVTKMTKCVVCSSACPANPPGSDADQLCWVCKRLKISAWRDSDVQMPAQE